MSHDFRERQIPPATRADWRHDARPTNYDGGRTAIMARRIIELLDALDEAEADLAQAWADGYNHAKVEMLSATIGERAECAACSGRGAWMDEPCSDCTPTAEDAEPCFARGVDGEGNPNCRLASDHDGQHSDSTSLTVTVNKSSAGVGLPNEEARWWQIRDLAAKGYADAGPAGVADALEPVLEDWFFEVRREAGLVAVREYVENGPICDE